MEPIVISGLNQSSLEQDKKIARTSLLLLFWVSLLHGLWLTIRNLEHIKDSIYQLRSKYDGQPALSIFFLVTFAIILIINFIPPIWAKRLYKKELYRKQIKVGIVSFIIFQSILHFTLFVLSRLLFATFC